MAWSASRIFVGAIVDMLGNTVAFHRGFAEVEMTPDNTRMLLYTQRSYPLEDLGPDTDIGVSGDPGTATCPECGYVSKSEFGLKAHLRKHKPT